MARIAKATAIYEAAALFRARCLEHDGSLFEDGMTIWSKANVDQLHELFVGHPDVSKKKFFEKFEAQLKTANADVVRLAAEIIAIYVLFSVSLTAANKRDQVNRILGWRQLSVSEKHPVMEAFGLGVGGTGQAFNQRKPDEIAFIMNFAVAWKGASANERATALQDAWAFRDFVDRVKDGERRAMRHALLHLVFPDSFERIASRGHKRRIAEAFDGLLGAQAPDDLDERLLAIRKHLTTLLGANAIDFYDGNIRPTWDTQSSEDDEYDSLAALQHKKQIVMYGPPGTGKTYQAKSLASALIRRAALKRHGAAWYFQHEKELAEAIPARIHRRQLHPGYSYEEFIVGLHVGEGGRTVHRLGYLPRLVAQLAADEKAQGDFAGLPYVLILDEINRTDLSRLLGEAFSLLEDRHAPVLLPGVDEDGNELRLALPKNLFVIGTMNLIDQSLEQIDFALRRRFLWVPCGFKADDLLEVCRQDWEGAPPGVHRWERVANDFRRLARAASTLNDTIRSSRALGEAYEIGHTYFFDVTSLLRHDLVGAKGVRDYYLWDKSGPKAPLEILWNFSLRPLLLEYLRGLDEKERTTELQSLQKAFLVRPALDDDE